MKKAKGLIIFAGVVVFIIAFVLILGLFEQDNYLEKYEGTDLSYDVRGLGRENTYKLYKLEEGKDASRQPGIEQTEDGTFIMSSRDMCIIEHIPELCEAGISSFKIEGRMKSVYYAAATALAYRQAVDAYCGDPENYTFSPEHLRILESVTHRKYDTGYFFDKPMEDAKIVDEPGYLTERPYFGIVSEYDENTGFAKIIQKNKAVCGDTVRFLTPDGDKEPFRITQLYDNEMQSIISTPHPKMEFYIKTPYPVGEGDILH